jgi:hypothetical protein
MGKQLEDRKVVLRHLTLRDYNDLKVAMEQAYIGSRMSYWTEESWYNGKCDQLLHWKLLKNKSSFS